MGQGYGEVVQDWERRREEQIILNTDPNCKLAFEIIERKLTSEDFLNKAGYDALKLNPECIKGSISDEDLKELEDKFGKIE